MNAMNHHKLSPSPLYAGERAGERGERLIESRDARLHAQPAPLPNPLPRVRGRRSKSAFTLIELLLVLVILGVLAALVVPTFRGRTEQARTGAARADITTIDAALELFDKDCGRFPTSDEGLRALVEPPPNEPKWHGPYVKRGLPKDPWDHEYVYRYPGQYNTYDFDLYSLGPDGREGNDDITNWNQK